MSITILLPVFYKHSFLSFPLPIYYFPFPVGVSSDSGLGGSIDKISAASDTPDDGEYLKASMVNIVVDRFRKILKLSCLTCLIMFRWMKKQP